MSGLVFVDTSAWIAAFVKREERHEDGSQAIETLLEEGKTLITTDYIFDEAVTRVRFFGGHDEAVDVGERILGSQVARVLEVDPGIRREAWRLFKKCSDQEFSFTDCTSFAVMRKFGSMEAFTFDDDFRKAGFVVLPRRRMG